jgi:hypothetical protein
MPETPGIVEHWILNLAIEGARKLSDFLPFVESLYLNVREVPDCNAEEYAEGVLALFDAGLVRLYFDIGEDGEIEPDRALVEAVIRRRLQLPRVGRIPLTRTPRPPREIRPAEPDLMMKLTASGGRAWERLAEPDWNRYVQTLTDDESGEAWSGNRDMLMSELGWYQELTSATIDRNTIRLEALHDYNVTYWKLLPVVFRATFACTWSEGLWGAKGYSGEPKWFREWWESSSNWYKQPWELPNWPRPL